MIVENSLKDKFLLLCFNLLFENKASFKNLILNRIFATFYQRVDLARLMRNNHHFDKTYYIATKQEINTKNAEYFFVAKRVVYCCNQTIKNGYLTDCKPYSQIIWSQDWLNTPYICLSAKLKDLKDSAKIWKDLSEKYGTESVLCLDREFGTTYAELSKYKTKKLTDFVKNYKNLLDLKSE